MWYDQVTSSSYPETQSHMQSSAV